MNYDLIKKYPHNLIKLEKTVWGEKFVSNRMKKRFPFGIIIIIMIWSKGIEKFNVINNNFNTLIIFGVKFISTFVNYINYCQ